MQTQELVPRESQLGGIMGIFEEGMVGDIADPKEKERIVFWVMAGVAVFMAAVYLKERVADAFRYLRFFPRR